MKQYKSLNKALFRNDLPIGSSIILKFIKRFEIFKVSKKNINICSLYFEC